MYSQSVDVVENVLKSSYLCEGKWIHVQVKWIRKTILNFAKFLSSNICIFIDDIMFKLIWFLNYSTKSDFFFKTTFCHFLKNILKKDYLSQFPCFYEKYFFSFIEFYVKISKITTISNNMKRYLRFFYFHIVNITKFV